MTYATLDQLTARYGEALLRGITDRAIPPLGTIDQATVDRALADTDAFIDGQLRRRYVTPLAETPPQIADIAQAIAIWKLHTYKPDEKFEIDYKDAVRTLRDIGDGTVLLTATLIAPAEVGGTGARLTDRARPLSADNLKGYI